MNKTLDYLNSILDSNSIVVIGCSGGPDSMCLLHLLCLLKNKIGFKIIVAHMNHKVRKEADEEANYVYKYSKGNNLMYEYYELKEKINSNFHSRARIIRYQFFDEVIQKYNATHLMTAHHGDDLIETILMRIQRGSNLKGYSGFDLLTDKKTYKQVKPLIFYTKEDIKNYLVNNNIKYYIDSTNEEDDYLRNRYRHHILPLLHQEYNLIQEKYLKFSNTINEADSFINNYLNSIIIKVFNNNILYIDEYKKEDKIIQKRIIEYILSTLYIDDLYKVSDANINEINKIIESDRANLSINLPNNHTLTKEYNKIYVNKMKVVNNKSTNGLYYEDNMYIIKEVDASNDTSNYTIRIDINELKEPLFFDNRKPGDKMFIKNSKGYRKIKDIFIDLKLSKEVRDNIPILYDSNREVLWIPGLKKSKYDKKENNNNYIILNCIKK
ncbi:MAG: tRNA lysidine(34) synthetase TilS [Bacilli bacterium]|nr:tRNA lysidine(34) synthetase TilS [Bacilli bacterium]